MFVTRRNMLKGFASLAALSLPALPGFNPANSSPEILRPMSGKARLLPESYPETDIWGFGGAVPGPEIRIAQGARVHRRLVNDLEQPTSIHWHGIHIDNSMDGVTGLTQGAVAPGGKFDYAFAVPDAGTYWYHSHERSSEQVARGLYGALIVEEPAALDIDREVVLLLDDWRLQESGQIFPDFMRRHDRAHSGRYGNLITTNSQYAFTMPAQENERLRLRLINAANARIFPLALRGLRGWVMALDGMPLDAPRRVEDMFFLAPGQRVDLVADVTEQSGGTAYIERLEDESAHAQVKVPVNGIASTVTRPDPEALPSNPQPVPRNLSEAAEARLIMEGGAMGGMQNAILDGDRKSFRQLVGANQFWAFNGVVGMTSEPLLQVDRGETVRLAIENNTAFPHGMHLHGQHFCEIDKNGTLGPMRDTILVFRGETREIAFVAGNPGKWLFHCHTLSHQDSGMKTWIKVRT